MTRLELDNQIANDLADFSNIVPTKHRGVSTSLADYTDQEKADAIMQANSYTDAKLLLSSGIYLKDSSLIIPSSGTFINSLDFVGASSSYIESEILNHINPLYARITNTINIATTALNGIPLAFDGVGIEAVYHTGDGVSLSFIDVAFDYLLPDNNYMVQVQIGKIGSFTTGAGEASLYNYIITNKTSGGFRIAINEGNGGAQQYDDIRFRVIPMDNDIIITEQNQNNIDLSVGGTFALTAPSEYQKLQSLKIVINGGATPGVYRII